MSSQGARMIAGPTRRVPARVVRLVLVAGSLVAAIAPLACGGKGGEYSISSLTEKLKDSDPNMRYWAARSLGTHGAAAKDTVPALTELLKDPSPLVRMGAASALAGIGPDAQSAIPALKEALKDKDKDVRQAAAVALKKAQGKR